MRSSRFHVLPLRIKVPEWEKRAMGEAAAAGLGRAWLAEIEAWLDAHGLCGYDPFDVKQHRWVRAAQPHYFARKAATALCDMFPYATRRVLGIAPTENAKAHALVAHGALRLAAARWDETHLERALGHLGWLRAHASRGYHGLCWGYPFDVAGKGVDTPAGTPVGVVSAIAGMAFLEAHQVTGEAVHLEAARYVAEFVLKDLPRLEAGDGTYCFAYTPGDHRRVHNANLLAVELLERVAAATGENTLREMAAPALAFTLARQRDDGAWAYGEAAPAGTHEAGLLALVDHHHTGFVLRSLDGILRTRPDAAVETALARGFRYYLGLFARDGMPINAYGSYPVDIHACAEAVLCGAVLGKRFPEARTRAEAALRWTHAHLRRPSDGAPYYRKYPFFTSKLVCPRWGVAWMYRALAEYVSSTP